MSTGLKRAGFERSVTAFVYSYEMRSVLGVNMTAICDYARALETAGNATRGADQAGSEPDSSGLS